METIKPALYYIVLPHHLPSVHVNSLALLGLCLKVVWKGGG